MSGGIILVSSVGASLPGLLFTNRRPLRGGTAQFRGEPARAHATPKGAPGETKGGHLPTGRQPRRGPLRFWFGLLLLALAAAACAGEQQTTESTLDALRSAAEQGDSAAQYSLGVTYDNGTGVPEDDSQAVHWYRMAAEQGHLDAQARLGSVLTGYLNRSMPGLFERLPVDVAESLRWHRMAAEQGHTGAQYTLGEMYYDGTGVPEDKAEAARWYRLVAEQGDDIVQDEFGRLLRMDAQNRLGDMYAQGEGVPENDLLATIWYRSAAEQGSVHAQVQLGYLYSYGGGTWVLKDVSEAYRWYRLAAQQGDTFAQTSLGAMSEMGEGTLKDLVLAHMWYNIASANGDEQARGMRDRLEGDMTRTEIDRASELARTCMASDYRDCER